MTEMGNFMKKISWKIIGALVAIVVFGIYYYVTLPAFNLHAKGTWYFLIGAVIIIGIYVCIKTMRFSKRPNTMGMVEMNVVNKLPLKIVGGILLAMIVVLLIGTFLSSPVINATKYIG